MLLYCERCNDYKVFHLDETENNGITRISIACSHCNLKHDVMFQDDKMRAMISDSKNLIGKPLYNKHKEKINKQNEINKNIYYNKEV